MKKVFVIAAAAMMLAACQKEEVSTTKTISLNASMEQMSGDSKTTFGTDGLSIVWEEGDEILVIDQNGKEARLQATKGGSETTFTGEVGDDFESIKYAFYPASIFSNYRKTVNTYIDFTLDQNRPCSVDALASGANPSWATVEEGATYATFNNLCGILKITVDVQSAGLTSLILKDNNYAISGKMTLTLSGVHAGDVARPGTGSRYATISNDSELTTGEHEFYFVAPEGAFNKGAMVYANTYVGETSYVYTTRDNSLSKSTIKVMPELKWLGGNLYN